MNIKTTVDKTFLLNTLKENREHHQTMADEALLGYKDATETLLRATLNEAMEVDFSERVYVNVYPPCDHLSDYDTVIGMLEASVDDTLELDFIQYRNFVEDEWDWSQNWVNAVSGLSTTANIYALQKNY